MSVKTPKRACSIGVAAALLMGAVAPAMAYTAAGDREFPATILLPQIGPADELYLTGTTQPVSGGRESTTSATYDKALDYLFPNDIGVPLLARSR